MKKKLTITATLVLAMLFGTIILPQTTSANTFTEFTPLVQYDCIVVGNDDRPLRVRETPGGKIIGSLKIGTRITVYDVVKDTDGSDWAEIKFRKGIAYVSDEFVNCN